VDIVEPVPGAAVLLSVARLRDSQGKLHSDEEFIARGMTRARLREFRAARTLARATMRALGEPESAIRRGEAGEPIWAPGIVGSLSHTRTHAAALVARASAFVAVGVDLDDDRLIGDAAAAELMNRAELEVVLRRGLANTPPRACSVVFSAKEALFKCQYPLTFCGDLQFDDVELVADSGPGSSFGVVVRRNLPSLARLASRVHIITLVIQGLTLSAAFIGGESAAKDV